MTTRLTTNFTLEELTQSATAKKYGIENVPDAASRSNLWELAVCMLQPIREKYGAGVSVNSGYRCRELNKKVGGASNSSHMYGLAADIKASNGNMKALQKAVMEWSKTHVFDQIIIEQPVGYTASWIHVGWKRGVDGSQRCQILYAKKENGSWKYYTVAKGSRYYNP